MFRTDAGPSATVVSVLRWDMEVELWPWEPGGVGCGSGLGEEGKIPGQDP